MTSCSIMLLWGAARKRLIGRRMNVSVKTVGKQRATLMSKLKVHNVAGLVRTAIKHSLGLLD